MSFYGRSLHELLYALVFWFKTVQIYNVHVNDETEHIRPEGAKKQSKQTTNNVHQNEAANNSIRHH